MRRFVIAASTAVWAAAPAAAAPDRANVVVIVSDDHMPDALGCAGNPAVRTPRLDQLAADGVRFTRCFSPNPICTPARACILTGQDSWTNGCVFFGEPIRETSPLWPRLLAGAGYDTFFTGKWHNDGQPSTRGFTCGEAIYAGGMMDHAHPPVIRYGEPKSTRKPADKHATELFVDAAVRFLETRRGDRPFCIYLAFTAPHDPWIPPAEYATIYAPEQMPVRSNFMPRPPFKMHPSFPELRDQRQLPFPRTRDDVRRALTQYYGMITHMDAQIGRLLDKLDQLELAADTLVIFVGDQGYSMGSHGFVGKQTMYDEGIITPLVVRYGRLQRGRPVHDALVSIVDLFPTICEAAGVEVPEAVEGRSLLGLYQGKADKLRDCVFASFHSPTKHFMSTRCVRAERHKLIQHLLTGEVELFDLAADPFELANLAGRAEHAELQQELTEKLMKWRSTAEEK
ncbi:MAG: sulfatase family protein [Planctomycetota bacterium]|jgi:arylsulfatase A-like enzyme